MAAATAGSAEHPLHVLVVEDSKMLAERICELLRQLPYVNEIDTVDTEEAARGVMAHEQVDVMILDLHLRQGNGFGVLRALSNATHRPYVVVLTNYDLPQYKEAALALGATYFMDKIRDYDRLSDAIRELHARTLRRA